MFQLASPQGNAIIVSYLTTHTSPALLRSILGSLVSSFTEDLVRMKFVTSGVRPMAMATGRW